MIFTWLPLEARDHTCRFTSEFGTIFVPIKRVFGENQIAHLVHHRLKLSWEVGVIGRNLERIEEAVVLREVICLGTHVLRLQEASQGITKLIANIEVDDLTIGLWVERVTVVISVSTIATCTEQTIDNHAVLIDTNASVGVG